MGAALPPAPCHAHGSSLIAAVLVLEQSPGLVATAVQSKPEKKSESDTVRLGFVDKLVTENRLDCPLRCHDHELKGGSSLQA